MACCFCVQCGTCPVCRTSLNTVDELVAVSNTDTQISSSSSHEGDTGVGEMENLPVVTVDVEMPADVQVPVLSPTVVIDDVEHIESDARL